MAIALDQLSGLAAGAHTASTIVLTWTVNPAAGAKVLVFAGWDPVSVTVTSVQDNGTSVSTFTLDKTVTDTSNAAILGVYRADGISLPASGSYKVTITFSSFVYVAAGGASYTGVKSGGPAGSSTGTGTSTAVSTGTGTPLAAGALFFAAFTTDSNASAETITVTATGFTGRFTEPDGATYMSAGCADKIDAGGPAATAGTWTLSDAPSWCGAIVAYDALAAVNAPAQLATGTGTAPASGMAQAGSATGTGIAQSVGIAQAQLAAGTGTAPASGMALTTTAAGTGAALTAGIAAGADAQLAAGTGIAQQPSVLIGTTGMAPAGLAAATGTALASGMAQAQLAAAAGVVTPSVMVQARLATATGVVTPSVLVQARLATGTGTALASGMAQAQLAAAAGVVTPSVLVPVRLAMGAGTAGQAFAAIGGTVTSPGLEGYGFGSFPDVPAGSVITSVIAVIAQHGSNALIDVPSYELWDGTSVRIGAPQTGKSSTKPGNTDVVTFTGVSYAQLATLRLRVYATSAAGNSGATVSVDAVSLAVVWIPASSAAARPGTLAVTTGFPVLAIATDQTALPATLAVATARPAATAGTLPAAVLPLTLAAVTAFPAAAPGTGISFTPGTLALSTLFPAPAESVNESFPEWASADDVQPGGTGSWTNAGNLTGTPDNAVATWTVP